MQKPGACLCSWGDNESIGWNVSTPWTQVLAPLLQHFCFTIESRESRNKSFHLSCLTRGFGILRPLQNVNGWRKSKASRVQSGWDAKLRSHNIASYFFSFWSSAMTMTSRYIALAPGKQNTHRVTHDERDWNSWRRDPVWSNPKFSELKSSQRTNFQLRFVEMK